MPYTVDFDTASTVGLESSPAAAALAGLRAHEARYFEAKYNHVFTVEPAAKAKNAIAWVERILKGSATSSSRLARSKRQPSRSRTLGWHTCSTRVVSRSM
jgi:hypothetical protein